MTIAVDLGRKEKNKQTNKIFDNQQRDMMQLAHIKEKFICPLNCNS